LNGRKRMQAEREGGVCLEIRGEAGLEVEAGIESVVEAGVEVLGEAEVEALREVGAKVLKEARVLVGAEAGEIGEVVIEMIGEKRAREEALRREIPRENPEQIEMTRKGIAEDPVKEREKDMDQEKEAVLEDIKKNAPFVCGLHSLNNYLRGNRYYT